MEEQFEGLQATLKQLRSEKAALQKDAASIPALKADIQALQAQVPPGHRSKPILLETKSTIAGLVHRSAKE